MKHGLYLAPSCEVTELAPRDAVLTSASNEGYTTKYYYDDPFDDDE